MFFGSLPWTGRADGAIASTSRLDGSRKDNTLEMLDKIERCCKIAGLYIECLSYRQGME